MSRISGPTLTGFAAQVRKLTDVEIQRQIDAFTPIANNPSTTLTKRESDRRDAARNRVPILLAEQQRRLTAGVQPALNSIKSLESSIQTEFTALKKAAGNSSTRNSGLATQLSTLSTNLKGQIANIKTQIQADHAAMGSAPSTMNTYVPPPPSGESVSTSTGSATPNTGSSMSMNSGTASMNSGIASTNSGTTSMGTVAMGGRRRRSSRRRMSKRRRSRRSRSSRSRKH